MRVSVSIWYLGIVCYPLSCLRLRFDTELNIQGIGNAQDGRQKRRIFKRLDTSDSGMCDTCFLSQLPLRPTFFNSPPGQFCDNGFVGVVDGQKFSPRCYRVKGHGDKKKRPVQPMQVERANGVAKCSERVSYISSMAFLAEGPTYLELPKPRMM